jgi:site-specific DNA recombinase
MASSKGQRAAHMSAAAAPAPRAIGYIRVSTDRQSEHGVSLDAQAEKIRAMATVQGSDLVDIIVDGGESGKSLQRPGMDRLLELVEARRIDTVIVAKLDRLTRSVTDLGELLERFQRKGVSLCSVSESLDTGTAAGRLVLNVMASVSQWEREAIGERTRDALRHKRAQGQRAGNVPYGFRLAEDAKTLLPEAGEQDALSIIRDCREAGFSFAETAEELNYQSRGFRGDIGRHQIWEMPDYSMSVFVNVERLLLQWAPSGSGDIRWRVHLPQADSGHEECLGSLHQG